MIDPSDPLDWSLIRSFCAVMRHGSLSEAARQAGATQPTLGRHIRALEQRLGEPLFVRRANRLEPTERALALHDRAEAMDEAAAAFARLMQGGSEAVSGVVRLSVPEAFATHVMPPILAGLMEAHPRLEIELVSSNKVEDLHRREADIAVRLLRPTQGGLTMRKVGSVEVSLYAAPAYVKRHGLPAGLDDFRGHRLIGDDRSQRLLAGMRAAGVDIMRRDFRYRSDAVLAQMAAIEAGIGIGAGLVIVADGRGLIRVLPERPPIHLDVHVVAHDDLRRSRRIRAVFDHVAAGLARFLREHRASGLPDRTAGADSG